MWKHTRYSALIRTLRLLPREAQGAHLASDHSNLLASSAPVIVARLMKRLLAGGTVCPSRLRRGVRRTMLYGLHHLRVLAATVAIDQDRCDPRALNTLHRPRRLYPRWRAHICLPVIATPAFATDPALASKQACCCLVTWRRSLISPPTDLTDLPGSNVRAI